MGRKKLMDVIEPAIATATYSALMVVGKLVSDHMKNEIRSQRDGGEGRLADSITYGSMGTKLPGYLPYQDAEYGNPVAGEVGPKAEDQDVISPVRAMFTMKVGTRVPYARYVNDGSGPHVSANDSEGFVQRITEWGQRKGWSRDSIYKLMKHIRENGTDPHPFIDSAAQVAKDNSNVIYKTWSVVAKQMKPIRLTITARGKEIQSD